MRRYATHAHTGNGMSLPRERRRSYYHGKYGKQQILMFAFVSALLLLALL